MRGNRFPPGWNEERVRRLLAYYEEQTEAAVAEDEAAFEDKNLMTVTVPKELMPLIRQLIAKHQKQGNGP